MRSVTNHDPAEILSVHETTPDRRARLSFLSGRAATLLADGRSAWPDSDGGRVVVFDAYGVVDTVLQGGPTDERRLERPSFVAAWENGLAAFEADGACLVFERAAASRWVDTGGKGSPSGARGRVSSSRSILDIPLRPLPPGAPLLWMWVDGEARPVGEAMRGREPLLGSLLNSGWSDVSNEGDVYFASAVRPELHRYAPDGTLRWTSRWIPDAPVDEPRFGYDGTGLVPRFTLVQQAMVVGPDDRLYVLAPNEGTHRDRVLVFEDDGTLLRAGTVPRDAAVYLDSAGNVWATPAASALARTGSAQRVAFPPFDLPALGEGDPLALADLHGDVVVVNF